MKKENMAGIYRLNSNILMSFEEDIKKLIRETIMYNFPKVQIDDHYLNYIIEDISKYLINGTAVIYVGMDNGNIQGWIWCHEIFRFNERRLHIAYFSVFERYRNVGLGRKLIRAAEDYARENKYCGLDLLVTKNNVTAVDFYFNNNFTVERYLLKKEINYDR